MRILVGIHEPGIIDHVNALCGQIIKAGADVTYVAAADSADLQTPGNVDVMAPVRTTGESVYQQELPDDWTAFDATFVQTPYDEQRQPLWRKLSQADGLGYAGYGTALSNWTHGHYDLDFYSRCRFLLVPSERSVAEHTTRGVKSDHVRHTGDPLLFEVRTAVEAHPAPHRPSILWLPHWTLDWFGSPGYSTWSTTVYDVLSVAELTGVALTVRPHPLLRRTLDDATSTPEAEALKQLMQLPNVRLSASSLLDDLLDATSVLTDGVSVISYACAAGLPVGVCRRPDSPPFGAAGNDIVAQCDILANSEDRAKWLLNQSDSALERDPSSPAARCVYRWFPLRAEPPGNIFLNWLAE